MSGSSALQDHRRSNFFGSRTRLCLFAYVHLMQVCKAWPKPQINPWVYAIVSVAALIGLCLMIMLASLFVSMCLARTGKWRRQIAWWTKHLSGMPQTGKMSIVVTDIEGYSGAHWFASFVVIVCEEL